MAYVDQPLGDFLALVSEPTPAPGGGAVAAISASLAAGLVAMADPEHADVESLRHRAAALADEDAAAYSDVVQARRTGASATDALARATEVPLDIAATAAEIARCAAEAFDTARTSVRGDVRTAVLLAEAATCSAAYLVEINVEAGGGTREHVDRARAHVAAARTARENAGG